MYSKFLQSAFLVVTAILCCSCGVSHPNKAELKANMCMAGTFAYDQKVASFVIKPAEAKQKMKDYFAKNNIKESVVPDAPSQDIQPNSQIDKSPEEQMQDQLRERAMRKMNFYSYDIRLVIGREYVFSKPKHDKIHGGCLNLAGYYLNGDNGEIKSKNLGELTSSQVGKLRSKNKMGKSSILKKK